MLPESAWYIYHKNMNEIAKYQLWKYDFNLPHLQVHNAPPIHILQKIWNMLQIPQNVI